MGLFWDIYKTKGARIMENQTHLNAVGEITEMLYEARKEAK